ncbi:MAG: hypothetical protein U0T73_06100 [Chitinophagales bacterium]
MKKMVLAFFALVLVLASCKTQKHAVTSSTVKKTTPFEDTLNARIQAATYIILNNLKGGESPEFLAIMSLIDRHYGLGINSVKWKIFESKSVLMHAYGNYMNNVSVPPVSDAELKSPAIIDTIIQNFHRSGVRFGWMTFCDKVPAGQKVIDYAYNEAMKDTQLLPEVVFIFSEIKIRHCYDNEAHFNELNDSLRGRLKQFIVDSTGGVKQRVDLLWTLRAIAFLEYYQHELNEEKVIDFLLKNQYYGGWGTYPKPVDQEALSKYNFDMFSSGFGLWSLLEMRDYYKAKH